MAKFVPSGMIAVPMDQGKEAEPLVYGEEIPEGIRVCCIPLSKTVEEIQNRNPKEVKDFLARSGNLDLVHEIAKAKAAAESLARQGKALVTATAA